MSDQTPSSGSLTPPPLPPTPAARPPGLSYANPMQPAEVGRGSNVQRFFDTVAGPNLRIVDNLLQLACAVLGGVVGGLIGWIIGRKDVQGRQIYLLGGMVGGLLLAVALSGIAIGIIRGRNALKRK